jgi:mannan endo-1,4-beta-mannosidase
MFKKVALLVLGLTFAGMAVPPKGFVYTQGKDFMLDGKKFFYGGNNIYFLLTMTDTARQHRIFDSLQAHKINVVRCWGFSCNSATSWQPTPTTINEDALKTLDYGLKLAREHCIRIVLPLVNHWDYDEDKKKVNGGMSWYVKVLLNRDDISAFSNQTLFYTDSKCKDAYKNYVKSIINRKNIYTGILYKDDPFIFSWQLANEPRDRSNNGGDNSGTRLYNWINEMGAYVKGLAPNHMVSTGEEGGGTNGKSEPTGAEDGVDFVRNTNCQYIDFATVHLYAISWGNWDDNKCNTYIKNRVSKVNKPIVIEEFGLEKSNDNTRVTRFSSWIKTAIDNGYNGFNPWMMTDQGIDDDGWAFRFDSPTGKLITDNAKIMYDKCPACKEDCVTASRPLLDNKLRGTSNLQINNQNNMIVFTFSPNKNYENKISIYNAAGVLVKTLNAKLDNTGLFVAQWNGRLDNGKKLSTNVYWCTLNNSTEKTRFVVVK